MTRVNQFQDESNLKIYSPVVVDRAWKQGDNMTTDTRQAVTSNEHWGDFELRRACEYCGGNLTGRAEKRFCANKCGTAYRKEEEKMESLALEFLEALKSNREARFYLDIQERHRAQVQAHRIACLIADILHRRATVAPLVNRVIEVEFNDAVKKYLWGFTHRFDDYQDVFLNTGEQQVYQALNQLTGVTV